MLSFISYDSFLSKTLNTLIFIYSETTDLYTFVSCSFRFALYIFFFDDSVFVDINLSLEFL